LNVVGAATRGRKHGRPPWTLGPFNWNPGRGGLTPLRLASPYCYDVVGAATCGMKFGPLGPQQLSLLVAEYFAIFIYARSIGSLHKNGSSLSWIVGSLDRWRPAVPAASASYFMRPPLLYWALVLSVYPGF